MNNGVPTAQIVERNAWRTKLDFVGHRKAVTVVVSFDVSTHEKELNQSTTFLTEILSANFENFEKRRNK
jgi:protein HIRA/HIR1